MSKVTALIPAAGMGTRMGGSVAKQFLPLGGKPLLAHTLLIYQHSPDIDEIIPILSPSEMESCRHDVLERYQITKVRTLAAGGRERHDSVNNGLQMIGQDTTVVLVHDGARPLVTGEMIHACVELAKGGECVTVGVPLKDTIKEVDDRGIIQRTLDRSRLWAVQTPQAFPAGTLKKAHEEAFRLKHFGTDDAALVERSGSSVRIIMGSYENLKITTPEDLIIAEEILKRR